MKRIKNTSSGGNLSVILISLAIGLVLFLSNSDNIRAKSTASRTFNANPIRARVQQIYTSQIGVREKPLNSGPQVEKYLKYVGLGKGNPWCAAFVCWVFGEAGVENPRSGWSPDLFAGKRVIWQSGASSVSRTKNQESRFGEGNLYKIPRNHAAGITTARRSAYPLSRTSYFMLPASELRPPISITSPYQTSDFRLQTSHKPPVSFNLPTQTSDLRPPTSIPRPQTGDIFGLYFPEKGRIAHTGFIDQWDGTRMISVEGNTNIAGSREGDGVYRKRRLVRSVYRVARYINY